MKLVSNPQYPQIIGVRDVRIVSGYDVHITFTDGTERDIDLEPFLWGPVFEAIRGDYATFASIFVDPIGQTLAWPGGVDLAPESLYYGDQTPPWAIQASTSKQPHARKHDSAPATRGKSRPKVRVRSPRRVS